MRTIEKRRKVLKIKVLKYLPRSLRRDRMLATPTPFSSIKRRQIEDDFMGGEYLQ